MTRVLGCFVISRARYERTSLGLQWARSPHHKVDVGPTTPVVDTDAGWSALVVVIAPDCAVEEEDDDDDDDEDGGEAEADADAAAAAAVLWFAWCVSAPPMPPPTAAKMMTMTATRHQNVRGARPQTGRPPPLPGAAKAGAAALFILSVSCQWWSSPRWGSWRSRASGS